MRVLVTYDVCTETVKGRTRLRKVAQACKGFGQRVQKSVFECSVSEVQHEEMRRRLVKIIDEAEDSLRLYRLRGEEDVSVEHFGVGVATDFEGPLVV